jgi:ketosteroid isomerase-like protein
MQRFLLIFAVLLSSVQAFGQCVKGYKPKTADESEIVRIENEWCDAAVKRDAVRLSNVFADDITWIEDVGYRTKDQVLQRYMVEIQEHGWELLDTRIRIEGEVAVVSSHIHVIKTVAGKTTDSNHTATDVFLRRKGKWQLIVE